MGEVNEEGKCPVILDSLDNTDRCIHLKAPATLKNLAVTSVGDVDYDELDFANDRHYEAIYITSNALLENLTVYGWLMEFLLMAKELLPP